VTDTVFQNGVTIVEADWLNDVNRVQYTIAGNPVDLAEMQVNLGISSKANISGDVAQDFAAKDLVATGDITLGTNNTSALRVTDTAGERIDAIRMDSFDNLRIGDSSGVDFLQIDSLFDQKFNIAGSEGFRVTGTGSKTTGVHEVTSGVKFPSTQVPSADPNTLDDYEEGTWTPSLSGSVTAGDTTYITQNGWYTKNGNVVTVQGRITVDLKGTLDGLVQIDSLPFTSSSISNSYGTCTISFAEGLAITAGESITGFVQQGATFIRLRIWNAATGSVYYDDAGLTDGADFMFVAVYKV